MQDHVKALGVLDLCYGGWLLSDESDGQQIFQRLAAPCKVHVGSQLCRLEPTVGLATEILVL
jgi:hypothetical protein